MVAAVTATLSQLGAVVVGSQAAVEADISQLQALVVYTAPAVTSYLSQIGMVVVADNPALNLLISQLQAIVVYVGTIDNPRIRVWNFALDDHDFYVLGLGNGDTLVIDLKSGQWSVWGNGQTSHWNAVYGMNWIGAGDNRSNFGSDIVAQDDSNGAIYFLDPTYPYDDSNQDGAVSRVPFECVAQGQIVVRGPDRQPCYGVSLTGSFGDVFSSAFTDVELSYSDDAGRTYVSAGTVSIDEGDYAARIEWRSLGSMLSPGRMFKVVDSGAVTRIDGLDLMGQDE